MHAAAKGHVAVLQSLLQCRSIDPNLQDKVSLSIAQLNIPDANISIFFMYTGGNVGFNAGGIRRPGGCSFDSGRTRWSELGLTKQGTTLLTAIQNINMTKEVVHFSLKQRGKTALMWASRDGHIDVVRILLAKGADASIKNHVSFHLSFFMEVYPRFTVALLICLFVHLLCSERKNGHSGVQKRSHKSPLSYLCSYCVHSIIHH